MADSIKVAVRFRKLIQREEELKSENSWIIKENTVSEKTDGKIEPHKYEFDRVYDQDSVTTDIYRELITPILENAMSGVNGTVFAYGQTASGKTFTMLGNQNSPGIIPMCVADIYETVENTPDREFLIRISYMEIYNENVVDLFGDVRKSLNIYDKVEGGVLVKDVTEEVVTSSQQIEELLKRGEAARHYGSTNMNEKSSRSHTIFRVIIESRERCVDPRASYDGAVIVAHLNLVDLAGSEKARQTGATGQRLAEGGFINKSLLTLSLVINQLASFGQVPSNERGFVSFRDSKLTRILQNSLGGNSKTTIICNVTPASYDETISTLRFASSAKKIKNRPIVNEVLTDDALMRRMQQEIADLKHRLEMKMQEDSESGKLVGMQTVNQELTLKLAETERLQREQEERIQRLMNLISVSSQLKPSTAEESRQKKKRRETWCPGKGRHSLAPKFQPFGAGSLFREMTSLAEESDQSVVDEDHGLPNSFHSHFATDFDFVSVTQTVETQTESEIEALCEGSGDEGVVLTQLNQRVTDQEAKIEELQVSLASMEVHYTGLLAAKDSEIAELRSSRSFPAADCEILPEHAQDDFSGDKDELIRVKQLLSEKEKAISELTVTLNKAWDELKERTPESSESCKSSVDDESTLDLKIELEVTKSQLTESMLFSASLVEKIGKLEREIELMKKDKKTQEQNYDSLFSELEELREFTKYEKEYRDASFLEKQEEALRGVTEQLISAETQLKSSRGREEMLKSVIAEQKSEAEIQDVVQPVSLKKEMLEIEVQTDLCEPDSTLLDRIRRLEDELKESQNLINDQNNQIVELERISRENSSRKDELPPVVDPDLNVPSAREAELSQEMQSLEERLKISDKALDELRISFKEQAALAIDAQNEALELQDEVFTVKTALEECEKKITDLQVQLQTKSKALEDLLSSSIAMKSSEVDVSTVKTGVCLDQKDESLSFLELQAKYDKVVRDLKVARDQLHVSSNKDIEIQKSRADLERVIKETNAAVAQSNQENKALIDQLNKEVYDLSCQLQKSLCDLQVAEHRLTEAEKEKSTLKSEIQAAEGMLSRQDFLTRKGPGDLDPEKLMERIKKLSQQNDLTTQRCQNFEAKIKSMEVAAQKSESLSLERDGLQLQLRESQHLFLKTRDEMMKMQQARNNSYTETAQMTMHVANLESKLQAAANQRQVLQEQVDSMMKEQELQTHNSNRLSVEVNDKNKEILSKNEQLKELTNHVDLLKKTLEAKESEIQAVVHDLENMKLERNNTESDYKQQIEQLNKDLEEARRRKATSEAELEKVTAEYRAIESQLFSIKDELSKEVLINGGGRRNSLSEKVETTSQKIEEIREEEKAKWTKLIEEKTNQLTAKFEESRRLEILEIQKQTMEKLAEIESSHETRKQQEFLGIKDGYEKRLHDLEASLEKQMCEAEDDFQKKLAHLKAENESLSASVKEHRNDLDELDHRFKQDLHELESEKADMEVILTKKEAELEDLEQQLKQLSDELADVERRHAQGQSSSASQDELQRSLDSLKMEHKESLDAKESELKNLKDSHNEEIKALQRSCNDQANQLHAEHKMELERIDLKHYEELDAATQAKIEIERRLDDLKVICDNEMRDHEALKSSFDELARKNSENAEQKDRLSQQVSQLLEMLEASEQKYSEACLAVAHLEDSLKSCDVLINEKEKNITKLQTELEENQKSLAEKSERLSTLEEKQKNNRDEIVTEVADLRNRLTLKEAGVHHLEETVKSLTLELSIVNDNLQKADLMNVNKDGKIQELNDELIERFGEIESKDISIGKLKADYDDLKRHHEELNVRLQTLLKFESEVSDLQSKLADLEIQYGANVATLQGRLNDLEKQKIELELDVEKLKAQHEKDKFEINDLEKYCSEISEKANTAGQLLSEAQDRERLEKNRRTQQASDAPRLRRERNELRLKVTQLENQLASLNFELATAKTDRDSSSEKLKEEIVRLKSEQDVDLKACLKESRMEVAKLNLEINRLETELVFATDPLKSKVKSLVSDLAMSETEARKLKDEVKKLKALLAEKSISVDDKKDNPMRVSPRNPEMFSVGTVSGGGVISDFNYYSMKAECNTYKTLNERLKKQVTSLESKLDQANEIISKLQSSVKELEKELSKVKHQPPAATPSSEVPRASPGVAEKQASENKPDPAMSANVQKWIHEASHPYEMSFDVKEEGAGNCNQQ